VGNIFNEKKTYFLIQYLFVNKVNIVVSPEVKVIHVHNVQNIVHVVTQYRKPVFIHVAVISLSMFWSCKLLSVSRTLYTDVLPTNNCMILFIYLTRIADRQ